MAGTKAEEKQVASESNLAKMKSPTEKKDVKATVPIVSQEITRKNHHCLHGINGNNGIRDMILAETLNRKLRIVRNPKTKANGEDDNDDENKEMTEDARRNYTTAERDGRYFPIRTDPEKRCHSNPLRQGITAGSYQEQNQGNPATGACTKTRGLYAETRDMTTPGIGTSQM